MWFQRLVEIDDEPDPEPILETAERPAAVHSSVRTKKAKVVVSTPADFQRVRLMSILRPKEQKAKEEPQKRTLNPTYDDIEVLEQEYLKNPMPSFHNKQQLAEDTGADLATISVCSDYSSYNSQLY
jgi:hypothetical protein